MHRRSSTLARRYEEGFKNLSEKVMLSILHNERGALTLAQRPAEESESSGNKRAKLNEFQLSGDIGDTRTCIVVSARTELDLDEPSTDTRYAELSQTHGAPRSSSMEMSTISTPNSREPTGEVDQTEGDDKKLPPKIEVTTSIQHRPVDERIPVEEGSATPTFALSRLLSEDPSIIQNSNSSVQQTKRSSLFGSEYSVSAQSEEPRSLDLTTPISGPETIFTDNNSVALSPRSRTPSLVTLQHNSNERKHSTSSSTEEPARTPLPTKKESNSQRHCSMPMMEMGQDTNESTFASRSAGTPRERSVDSPSHQNRNESDSRLLSTDFTGIHGSQRGLSTNEGILRNRSPSETPSSEIVGTDLSTISRALASPSKVLSSDETGTPPSKRSIIEDNLSGNRAKAAKSGPYSTFSSNFNVLTLESVERSQGLGNKPSKRRGRKPSSITSAERVPSNERGLAKSRPQRKTLPENRNMDNAAIYDGLPRQVPPIDHTPRVVFQIPDSPQPSTRAPPTNQLASVPPHLYRTLPPRPSITPPPGASPQLLQNYRPPAVVFTIDNRAESRLLTADVQAFIEEFTKHTRVLTPSPNQSAPNDIFPIGVIMWQSMPDFNKWYAETLGLAEIGALRFELLDVHWQPEKAFVVPEGNLNYFRTLKQYVWDLFWVGSQVDGGPSLFRVLISPFRQGEETLASAPAVWNPVNTKDSQARISGGTNLENIMVVAEPGGQVLSSTTSPPQPTSRQAAVLALPSRTSNIGHMLNTKEGKEFKGQCTRRSNTSPPNEQPSKPIGQSASGDNRPAPHPSQYIHGPPGPPVNTARTSWDKSMLRDRAHAFLVGRTDMELLSEESTVHDKLPYKTGAQVCGAVIDRNSGKGLVTITGKGFITQNIPTGPEETGNRYQVINIQPKQTCMIHGDAAILYFKRQTLASPPLQPSPPHPKAQSASSDMSSSSNCTSPIEIIVRLQMDGEGKFSTPFDKSVLRPKVTTTEFFSWFATQTRRGGSHGPPILKFTFKDAMPLPKATEVSRGNEDHFNYMRKDIKAQCEKAKSYMPDMKEFVVLVTVPGWAASKGEEEEEW